nr:DEAD-box ATP-dependent RNA helicase 51 [Tanacetum cinerariifolium]
TRQTAIFSATQTKKVEDLARLSFQNTPVYIDVDFGSFRNYYISKREEFVLFWKENMFLELHEHVVGACNIGSKPLLQDIISIFDGSVTTKAKEQDDLLLLWLQRCIWEWFERSKTEEIVDLVDTA